ncbi:hypothetical protein H9647_14480 [Paenibacillus sp. Sa2BVA9]|uniref:Uncharacterized protein n=2 Tax=Paenibacillus gallinarum TaxID=2762232 RepID=A0ABR8T0J8_9BACL|nr:hypothetical protein [Paenibacillus gallinarum]
MKKTDWIKIILVVSLLGNVALFKNQERDNRRQELKYELLNSAIYRDLGQLETTIQYQVDNNWENEALVTQKLDDAIDSVILNHAMEGDDNKEDLLWSLYEYLNEFKYGDEISGVSLNDNQRADYIYLGERLRSSGWMYNVGYDRNWNNFASKIEDLVTES